MDSVAYSADSLGKYGYGSLACLVNGVSAYRQLGICVDLLFISTVSTNQDLGYFKIPRVPLSVMDPMVQEIILLSHMFPSQGMNHRNQRRRSFKYQTSISNTYQNPSSSCPTPSIIDYGRNFGEFSYEIQPTPLCLPLSSQPLSN